MESATIARRKTCFIEEDDGLASLADTQAPGSHHHFISRPLYHSVFPRRSSLKNISSSSSSSFSSVRFCDGRYEEMNQPHFLDACALCKKPLGCNRDIFMYRGDMPFCTEECRQEQIEMDEAKEKSWNLSASMKALKRKEQRRSTSPNRATKDYTYPTSTVAAA